MGSICSDADKRDRQIERYKQKLIEATNISDSKKEMEVIDDVLFRMAQLGWMDILDDNFRKLNPDTAVCGNCRNFKRTGNTQHGTCLKKKYLVNRQHQPMLDRPFITYCSHVACIKEFERIR